MTLVISKIFNHCSFIESDTKITDIESDINKPYTERIKSIILNQKNCLSFAGNLNQAEYIYGELFKSEFLKKKDIISFFKSNLSYLNDNEFILTSHEGTPEIISFKKNEIMRNRNTSWIGDIDAFNFFQNIYLTNQVRRDYFDFLDEIDNEVRYQQKRFSQAFEAVIKNEKINSTGDNIITVMNKKNKGFEYSYGWYQNSGIVPRRVKGNEKTNLLISQTAEEGGFTFYTLAPKEVGQPYFGIYYLQGKTGLFFNFKISLKPIIYSNISASHFLSILRNEGFFLRGFIRE